jgi:hypothetical protein
MLGEAGHQGQQEGKDDPHQSAPKAHHEEGHCGTRTPD